MEAEGGGAAGAPNIRGDLDAFYDNLGLGDFVDIPSVCGGSDVILAGHTMLQNHAIQVLHTGRVPHYRL